MADPEGTTGREGVTHVVQLSGGIGSWGAGRRTADRLQPGDRLVALFCDVGDGTALTGEDHDVYDFVRQGAADLGAELVWLQDGRSIWDVFHDRRWLGNSRAAQCSIELKAKPARAWVEANCDPERTIIHVGIDWTEAGRLDGIRRGWAPWQVEALLCERPYLAKPQLLLTARQRGLTVPRAYALGFGHANCGGACVKAGQAAWARLLATNPARYADSERREAELRELLGDVSILRDRTGGATATLTLAEHRQRVEAGQQVDLFDEGGCGCFAVDAA